MWRARQWARHPVGLQLSDCIHLISMALTAGLQSRLSFIRPGRVLSMEDIFDDQLAIVHGRGFTWKRVFLRCTVAKMT
jgi:hypothetical protein